MEDNYSDILFYMALNVGHTGAHERDWGKDHDMIYCPRSWSLRKVKNKFARRNSEWDFETDNIWVGLIMLEPKKKAPTNQEQP